MSEEKTIADLEVEVLEAGKHLRMIHIIKETGKDPLYGIELRHGRTSDECMLYEMSEVLFDWRDEAWKEAQKRRILTTTLRNIRERFQVRWEGHDEP